MLLFAKKLATHLML
ncbi:hypothetical protein Patl1_35956 [Pistacia atlantica]|nr:hypothetical protein Patl1_35956 [Pistacia atlantica]